VKKILYVAPVLLFFFWGCSHSTAPTAPDYGYFPIELVSKWHFATTDNVNRLIATFVWENAGQVQLNNKTYFKILRYNSTPDSSTQTFYFRKDGNILYERTDTLGEHIVVDFSLGLNSKAYWDTSFTVVQKDDSMITFSTQFGADYGNSVTYKKNVGMVSEVSNGFILWQTKLVNTEWLHPGN
jgi:hypothetical protein